MLKLVAVTKLVLVARAHWNEEELAVMAERSRAARPNAFTRHPADHGFAVHPGWSRHASHNRRPPVPFSRGSWNARRGAREVKRSGT